MKVICHFAEKKISEQVVEGVGALPEWVESHIAQCADCRAAARDYAHLDSRWTRAALPPLPNVYARTVWGLPSTTSFPRYPRSLKFLTIAATACAIAMLGVLAAYNLATHFDGMRYRQVLASTLPINTPIAARGSATSASPVPVMIAKPRTLAAPRIENTARIPESPHRLHRPFSPRPRHTEMLARRFELRFGDPAWRPLPAPILATPKPVSVMADIRMASRQQTPLEAMAQRLSSTTATAQTTDAAAHPYDDEQMGDWYAQHGDNAHAAAYYSAAYKADPDSDTAFETAQSAERSGDVASAVAYYTAYLSDSSSPSDGGN